MGTDPSKIDDNSKKDSFHTKIWPRDHRLLKQLALKYGINIQNVVEQAIQLLRVKESLGNENISVSKSKIDLYQMQHLMLQDFHMVAVGRRTFSSLIQNLPETPIKKNNAMELVEWFHDEKKKLNELTLIEILQAIRSLWIAANYFTKIDILSKDTEDTSAYKMIFSHGSESPEIYGKYWLRYFKHFLTQDPLDFEIKDVKIRPQSFYLEIHEISPRIKPQSNIKPKIIPEGW
ncbi:MAG: hypothetical protein ACTSWW_03455 [Promethearchaeota archaeon]